MDWKLALQEVVQWVFLNYQMKVFAILLAVNLGLGIIAAIYREDFKLWAVADFLRRMLCYGGAYALVRLAGMVEATMGPIAAAVWAFVVAAMIGHILAALKDLDLPIPGLNGVSDNVVSRMVEKDG